MRCSYGARLLFGSNSGDGDDGNFISGDFKYGNAQVVVAVMIPVVIISVRAVVMAVSSGGGDELGTECGGGGECDGSRGRFGGKNGKKCHEK